jgi:hypothetical protein
MFPFFYFLCLGLWGSCPESAARKSDSPPEQESIKKQVEEQEQDELGRNDSIDQETGVTFPSFAPTSPFLDGFKNPRPRSPQQMPLREEGERKVNASKALGEASRREVRKDGDRRSYGDAGWRAIFYFITLHLLFSYIIITVD